MRPASSKHLIARLGNRTDVGRERALSELGYGLQLHEVTELASLLEGELGVPIGMLRVDDSVRELLAPFPLRNPLPWIFAEAALEDGVSEIEHQLRRKRESRGDMRAVRIDTIRDLFIAWCAASEDAEGCVHAERKGLTR